jgi:hypothetical protein
MMRWQQEIKFSLENRGVFGNRRKRENVKKISLRSSIRVAIWHQLMTFLHAVQWQWDFKRLTDGRQSA